MQKTNQKTNQQSNSSHEVMLWNLANSLVRLQGHEQVQKNLATLFEPDTETPTLRNGWRSLLLRFSMEDLLAIIQNFTDSDIKEMYAFRTKEKIWVSVGFMTGIQITPTKMRALLRKNKVFEDSPHTKVVAGVATTIHRSIEADHGETCPITAEMTYRFIYNAVIMNYLEKWEV